MLSVETALFRSTKKQKTKQKKTTKKISAEIKSNPNFLLESPKQNSGS